MCVDGNYARSVGAPFGHCVVPTCEVGRRKPNNRAACRAFPTSEVGRTGA